MEPLRKAHFAQKAKCPSGTSGTVFPGDLTVTNHRPPGKAIITQQGEPGTV